MRQQLRYLLKQIGGLRYSGNLRRLLSENLDPFPLPLHDDTGAHVKTLIVMLNRRRDAPPSSVIIMEIPNDPDTTGMS